MKKHFSFLAFLFLVISSHNSKAQCPEKTEEEWKTYFKERINELEPIEGLWSKRLTVILYSDYYSFDTSLKQNPVTNHLPPNTINDVIFKNGDVFYGCPCYVEGRNMNSFGVYRRTSNSNVFLHESYIYNQLVKNNNASFTNGNVLKWDYELNVEEKIKMTDDFFKQRLATGELTDKDYAYSLLNDDEKKKFAAREKVIMEATGNKIFPTSNDRSSHIAGSGTGFALANGFIVTNNHVINGAKTITIKGINGNFQKAYTASVVTVDKNNDLAIIQINDPAFKGISKIPYNISSKTSEVGSSVFVLGYPLRNSMGDEIKLTNGIISSKSGYQGDITCYQISAPLQPGNSGGPLFDSKGNLIGVVNAKLTIAENASYAIKTSYLLSLIESLSSVPKLQNVNILANKPLTEQVKTVKNFIYIIDVK